MNFSKTEKAILGFSLWGLLVLLALPYVDFSGAPPPSTPAFATVIPDGDDVRQRAASEFDWKNLNKSTALAENARVYTGRQSHAKVAFDDGAGISLEEQTLVLLSRDAKRSRVLDIEQGMAYLDLPGGDLFIRVAGQLHKISATKGRIRLEKKGDEVVLNLVSGKALLNGKDLSSTAKVNLSNAAVEKAQVRILVPDDGGIAWTEDTAGTVDFAWSQERPGEATVLLRSLTNGREYGPRTSVNGGLKISSLPFDDYEWVVRQGTSAERARFRLRPLSPPEITAVRSRDGALDVNWTDASLSDGYRVDVEDAMTGKIAFSGETGDKSLTTSQLARGTYNVRVTSNRAGRPQEKMTSRTTSHFHDQGLPPLDEKTVFNEKSFKIELTWPGADSVTTDFRPMSVAKFGWSGVRTDHVVQIARDYNFEKIIEQFDVSGREAEWVNALPGQFYVRVRPKSGVESWSGVSSLRLIYAAPVITGLSTELGKKDLRVVWDSHPRIHRFEIFTASNEDFFEARRTISKGPFIELPLADKKPVHLRVRGIAENGWPVTRLSKAVVFSPEPDPIRSVPMSPLAKAEPDPHLTELAATPSTAMEKPALDQWFRRTFVRVARFWSGLGLNYFRLGQTDNAALDKATFSNFTGPTIMAEVSAVFEDFYEVLVGYHDQPGRIDNAQYGLTQTNSRWQTLMGDVIGTFSEVQVMNRPTRFNWRVGLQNHRFPFLTVRNGVVSQSLNIVSNFSVGTGAEVEINKAWTGEAFLRYQMPFAAQSSAGTVTYSPQASFDGSVGAVRRINRNYLFGLYWFGQSQSMKYEYEGSGASSSGQQTFFNSNIQLRLGYEWEKK